MPNLQKSQSNRRVCFKFCSSINQAGETISLLSVYFITKSEEGYPVKERKRERKRKKKREQKKRKEVHRKESPSLSEREICLTKAIGSLQTEQQIGLRDL